MPWLVSIERTWYWSASPSSNWSATIVACAVPFETVTLRVALVVMLPLVSNARAVRAYVPLATPEASQLTL